MEIQVGKPLPVSLDGDGVIFTVDNGGAMLIYNLTAPTKDEIDAMKAGQPFEIRYAELGGILWIVSKCGSMPWSDAPFNPKLCTIRNWPEFQDGEGLSLALILTDAQDSTVQSARLIGLSTRFSRQLMADTKRLMIADMTASELNESIQRVTKNYRTCDLVRMSKCYCKIRGGH